VRPGLSPPAAPISAFLATVLTGIAAGGLLGHGLGGGPGWAWKAGLLGLVLCASLGLLLMRSLERRLWALFFAFMAGAAGSLAAPVYSLAVAARIGDPDASAAALGSGTISSDGNLLATLLWFAGALIAASLALIERRR